MKKKIIIFTLFLLAAACVNGDPFTPEMGCAEADSVAIVRDGDSTDYYLMNIRICPPPVVRTEISR